MRSLIFLIAATLATAFAAPATAQDQTPTPQLACRAAGLTYQIGEVACVPVCHQSPRLARCDAVSDAASWTYISEACPTALLTPLVGPVLKMSRIVNVSLAALN